MAVSASAKSAAAKHVARPASQHLEVRGVLLLECADVFPRDTSLRGPPTAEAAALEVVEPEAEPHRRCQGCVEHSLEGVHGSTKAASTEVALTTGAYDEAGDDPMVGDEQLSDEDVDASTRSRRSGAVSRRSSSEPPRRSWGISFETSPLSCRHSASGSALRHGWRRWCRSEQPATGRRAGSSSPRRQCLALQGAWGGRRKAWEEESMHGCRSCSHFVRSSAAPRLWLSYQH